MKLAITASAQTIGTLSLKVTRCRQLFSTHFLHYRCQWFHCHRNWLFQRCMAALLHQLAWPESVIFACKFLLSSAKYTNIRGLASKLRWTIKLIDLKHWVVCCCAKRRYSQDSTKFEIVHIIMYSIGWKGGVHCGTVWACPDKIEHVRTFSPGEAWTLSPTLLWYVTNAKIETKLFICL